MADRKAVVKNADMSEDMQQDAIDISTQALEKFNIEKDIAAFIKKEFDKKYNPTWHCIVGRNFGSYVTHETKHFIYFYLGQVAILLFKSGWATIVSPMTTGWTTPIRYDSLFHAPSLKVILSLFIPKLLQISYVYRQRMTMRYARIFIKFGTY